AIAGVSTALAGSPTRPPGAGPRMNGSRGTAPAAAPANRSHRRPAIVAPASTGADNARERENDPWGNRPAATPCPDVQRPPRPTPERPRPRRPAQGAYVPKQYRRNEGRAAPTPVPSQDRTPRRRRRATGLEAANRAAQPTPAGPAFPSGRRPRRCREIAPVRPP